MNSDETLWEGMLQGDQEMFLSLYNKYYHTLFFLGIREIKDAQLVKDTIQQLFLYLWEKRQTINVAKNVRSYLVMSFLRKLSLDWKKNARISTLQIVHSEYSEDYSPTPEEHLIDKDQQNHLYRLLMSYLCELPARQKELIILKFYEGLSYEEIVQQTGLSHRTVYNKIHEALKKLRLDIASNSQNNSTAFLSMMLGLLISYLE
ncbi:MAG: sigma-70 family RNA polymerase sigma factor [Chitinophagaceae bacterium]|nr:sigma-70 family RNA polymerase sigma factor [Chitinophagaceae bacterium]